MRRLAEHLLSRCSNAVRPTDVGVPRREMSRVAIVLHANTAPASTATDASVAPRDDICLRARAFPGARMVPKV